MSTTSRDLSKNTKAMAVGTLLSRLTGFGRTVAVVTYLAQNQNRLADTYNVANNAPNIVYELIVGGVLTATLVPVLVERFSKDDEADAWESASAILTAVLAVLVVATLLIVVFAPLIIDLYTFNNHQPDRPLEREVATYLLRLFAPQLAIYGFISVATGVLNARRVFAPPMFAPILNNIVVICLMVALPHIATSLELGKIHNDPLGLWVLGLGTTAGVLAMACMLGPSLRRLSQGRLRISWNPGHPSVRKILRMSGWTVGFVIANQVAVWLNISLAGDKNLAVTAFLTAYTFFILPHGIFAVSVMSALQPEMASSWVAGKVDAFRTQASRGVRLITFVMLPAGIGFALLAHPIINTIFHFAHLGDSYKDLTADAVICMVVGLPGFSAFVFLTRAFQSMHDAKTVFYLYLWENGVNVVTAPFFYSLMGIKGLALSQSLAYGVAAIAALMVLRRRTAGLNGRDLLGAFARIALATAAMAVVVGLVAHVLRHNDVLSVIGGILVGAVVFVGAALALRLDDVNFFLRRKRPAAS